MPERIYLRTRMYTTYMRSCTTYARAFTTHLRTLKFNLREFDSFLWLVKGPKAHLEFSTTPTNIKGLGPRKNVKSAHPSRRSHRQTTTTAKALVRPKPRIWKAMVRPQPPIWKTWCAHDHEYRKPWSAHDHPWSIGPAKSPLGNAFKHFSS